MKRYALSCQALTKESFAPFGDVIETDGAQHFAINAGTIERYHDLAQLDVGENDESRVIVSIVKSNQATALPHTINLVERHPLGTQAFIPMSTSPLVVVVAPVAEEPDPAALQAFISNGKQGINYRKGIWHMPLIAFTQDLHYVVVDRAGPGNNCDEYSFEDVEVTVTR